MLAAVVTAFLAPMLEKAMLWLAAGQLALCVIASKLGAINSEDVERQLE